MAAIYLIEFPNHPDLYYVGKTKRYPFSKRVYEHSLGYHKNYNDNLCHWYKKNNIKYYYTILEECSVEEMDTLETFYIRYFKWLGIKLTNHYDGTTISTSWTLERRLKHAEFRRQHKFSDETKEKMKLSKIGREVLWGDKISEGKKGKPNPFGENHLENIRKSRRESRKHSAYQLDLNNNIIKRWDLIKDAAEYLYSLPENKLTLNSLRNGIKDCCVRKQISAAGYRWRYIEDEIEKIPPKHTKKFIEESRGRPKGYKMSEYSKNQISINSKGKQKLGNNIPIYQIDRHTGEILNSFDSITDAAKLLNKNATNISSALNNNKNQKTAYGYEWKYK